MNTQELRKAIELALAGKWDESHQIVQQYDDPYACWVHAVLHKIEGDEGNSRYWYNRTGKASAHTNPEEELRDILSELTAPHA